MSGERHRQGMLDTNILILRPWIDPGELPDEVAISAITLAELSAGPHQVRRNGEQDQYDEHAERARRLEILQRAENEFDPVPFDAEAARLFGRVTAAVINLRGTASPCNYKGHPAARAFASRAWRRHEAARPYHLRSPDPAATAPLTGVVPARKTATC